MLKLNLKIAWRNLLKNKTYTGINVLGLAPGLAGFIFILIYINHEKNYDHWDPSLKNVYQDWLKGHTGRSIKTSINQTID